MLKLRVGGVPEHFNLPWQLTIESDILQTYNVDVEWVDFHGGTGQMAKALRDGSIDVAIILTEGIIAEIANGNQARIIKTYVQSPLVWGIHTASDAKFSIPEELSGATYAISRKGSGSHLMAILDAKERRLPVHEMEFEVVDSLDGAIKAFKDKRVDAFLWEKFTTEPYCDSGDLKRIGKRPTLWPCFMVAINPDVYRRNEGEVSFMLNRVFETAQELKRNPSAVKMIAKRYHLSEDRVSKWFNDVEWGGGQNLSFDEVKNVVEELRSLGIIRNDFIYEGPESFLI